MFFDGNQDPGGDSHRLLVVDVQQAVLPARRPAPILHAADLWNRNILLGTDKDVKAWFLY